MDRGGISRPSRWRDELGTRRRPRRPKESKMPPLQNITRVLRRQMVGANRLRWSKLPAQFFTNRAKDGSPEFQETLRNIFRHLDTIEHISTNHEPLDKIKFSDLCQQLSQLQDQVHSFQRLSMEDPSLNLTCADILYYFGLVRSLTSIIRRPARHFSLEEMLRINASAEQRHSHVWWEDYFQFVKKAFELLHYVFNWVDQSSNIIVNDEQFIHYLFVLIPVQACDVFIECTTVLEDLLTTKTKSMLDLKRIPILKSVVQHCSDSQFPFLCRVIAVIMSDNDNTKPANDTLKAHDEWLLNSTNHAISDSNQKYLIGLSDFVERLIKLSMRPLEDAENVWETMENLQSWVATTYVTQSSIQLLRQSLQEIFYSRNPGNENPERAEGGLSALAKLKIHNEKMYKIEALFILTLLLCGNHKEHVQKKVCKLNLIPGLNKLFKNFIWKSEANDDPPLMNPPSEDCSADTALKVQFLRLVHSVCDHHDNKYLLLSKMELDEIVESCHRDNKEVNASVLRVLENHLYCEEEEGLLSNILCSMKEAKETSTLRFWIARAVESFLRGPTCTVDQMFYLNRGILEHLLYLLLDIKTSAEVSQGHFDLLAELMKFNEEAFRKFETAVETGDRFDRFMRLACESLVDSNMFIRCATLTFHKFKKDNISIEKSRLLSYMSDKCTRSKLVASLIELITPETLNQENVSCLNTSLVFMITARREHTLSFYLADLSKSRNPDGVPLLENYQELLEFWLSHYSLSVKEKDCQSLEQGTGINFDEWTSTVEILLGRQPPDTNEPSLVNYLPCKERIHRDKSVSRLT